MTPCCEDNRAIVFDVDDELPVDELTHRISLALTYHDRKDLPLLGACVDTGATVDVFAASWLW